VSTSKPRAPRNRTLQLTESDAVRLRGELRTIARAVSLDECVNSTIHGNTFDVLPLLPRHSVDLIVADPPYNITKLFNGSRFERRASDEYEAWLDAWFSLAMPLLKPTASIYVCSEWRSSISVHRILEKYCVIQNRITWEREKGRGARRNWKNCSEDIWFGTVSDNYWFDVDAVKQKRRILAPYKDGDGKPKDWTPDGDGGFRMTCPSNIWSDISVPFWSMPENTEHPTQKPEKLIAKLILASSRPNEVVLDPFVGSGTTSVVAKKLGRQYIGVEIEERYCLVTEKRLEAARRDKEIQGYSDGCFWERNTLHLHPKRPESSSALVEQPLLFGFKR
jgi:site-specific DNA-methyltransferase (adenine-specific)